MSKANPYLGVSMAVLYEKAALADQLAERIIGKIPDRKNWLEIVALARKVKSSQDGTKDGA